MNGHHVYDLSERADRTRFAARLRTIAAAVDVPYSGFPTPRMAAVTEAGQRGDTKTDISISWGPATAPPLTVPQEVTESC